MRFGGLKNWMVVDWWASRSGEAMSMANWFCYRTLRFSTVKSAHSQYWPPVLPLLPDISPQLSRRSSAALLISALSFPFLSLSPPPPVLARDRRFNPTIPVQDYLTAPDGLKYYDLVEGKGPVADKGSTVQVHFDCVYRGITAVSSRESKLLAGNRIIAQPYEFTVGSPPGKERKREFVDNPNGLFSAQAAPKPPPALYSLTEGMRMGGKRTVIVTPDKGYGQKGMNEIPPGATFQLNIELLRVVPTEK